jgi:hypothetical protein
MIDMFFVFCEFFWEYFFFISEIDVGFNYIIYYSFVDCVFNTISIVI